MNTSFFRPPEPFKYESLQSMISSWKAWIKQFNIFMEATENSKKSDGIKVSMFRNLIGKQGNELYETFTWDANGDDEILAKVLEKFENHMSKNKSCRRK